MIYFNMHSFVVSISPLGGDNGHLGELPEP